MPTTSDGPAKAGHHVPHAITVCAFSMMLVFGALSRPQAAQCLDLSKDPAGCQPSTLDTPIGQMPSVRVNRQGRVDPFSSEEDARAGAAALEERLHLFRNFEHLHWVITVPRSRIPRPGPGRAATSTRRATAADSGSRATASSSGMPTAPACQARGQHFQDSAGPGRQPPVQVGEIPAFFLGNQGFDERELRALVYKTSSGEDRYILIRDAGTNTEGRMETVRIDPDTCLPISRSEDHRLPRTVARVLISGTTRRTPIASWCTWPSGRPACRTRKTPA